jgi:two-component system LytT family sensor kinase
VETSRDERRLFWTLQAAGWGIFFGAMFLAGIAQWPLGYTLVRKSSLMIIGFALTVVLRLPYRAMRRRDAPLALIAVVGVTLSTLAAAIWMAMYNLVMSLYLHRAANFPDFTNTIYYAFVLIAWSALYYGVPSIRAQAADRERLLKVEALAQQARLRALRLQLNPHFLFNTLNAISTLIAEQRGAEANRMLARLSDFLRMTLESNESDEIPIAEEIDFARRYLDIERSRFGERLHVDIAVAPGAGTALVPPMILQPLVENAVRHAILPNERGGTVAIRADRVDDWLTIGVDDDGPGIDAAAGSGSGIGLNNIRQRLMQMYGERSELRLSRSVRGGLAVSIRLPFREAGT